MWAHLWSFKRIYEFFQRCYECLCAQQWTQLGVRIKMMWAHLWSFKQLKWILTFESIDEHTNIPNTLISWKGCILACSEAQPFHDIKVL